jgi:hypothetical protein
MSLKTTFLKKLVAKAEKIFPIRSRSRELAYLDSLDAKLAWTVIFGRVGSANP